MKVSFKVKKLGIWWVFGDVADFKINKPINELRGTAKKVRMMIPPPIDSYSAISKIPGQRHVSGFSGRISNSSSGSNSNNLQDSRTSVYHSSLYQPGNLIKVS